MSNIPFLKGSVLCSVGTGTLAIHLSRSLESVLLPSILEADKLTVIHLHWLLDQLRVTTSQEVLYDFCSDVLVVLLSSASVANFRQYDA